MILLLKSTSFNEDLINLINYMFILLESYTIPNNKTKFISICNFERTPLDVLT